MVNTKHLIGKSIGGLIVSGFLTSIIFVTMAQRGGWGTRKTDDMYTFQYQGKSSAVKKEDRIWGEDRYYILINKNDKITSGQITTDDNKTISVTYDKGYQVRNAD